MILNRLAVMAIAAAAFRAYQSAPAGASEDVRLARVRKAATRAHQRLGMVTGLQPLQQPQGRRQAARQARQLARGQLSMAGIDPAERRARKANAVRDRRLECLT